MGRQGGASLGVAACLFLVLALPPAGADHCESGIVVYGRVSFTPSVLPPPLPRSCFSVETSGSGGHVLLPGTSEIFVRVEANLGDNYPVLLLKLDGLGFREQTYLLHRVAPPAGDVWSYDLPDWLSIPEPDEGGELVATVRFPGDYHASTRYTILALPDVPELPPV